MSIAESAPVDNKAEGGDLWMPEEGGTLGFYVNTPKEDRNLVICFAGVVILIITLFGILVKVANTNHIEFNGATLTVTSDKPSLFVTALLALFIVVPLVMLATVLLHSYENDVPLRTIPKSIFNGTLFSNGKEFLTLWIVMWSSLLIILAMVISMQIQPANKKYDYVLPHTGQTVEMIAYPDNGEKDRNFAQYYNPDTGEIVKTKVDISDLKVEPWKSTYTITHIVPEKETNTPAAQTGITSGSSVTVKEVKTFNAENGDIIILNPDGSYTITEPKETVNSGN